MFPASFLDEIRARVGLVQVVGRRVKLTKAGREWKGCCPFHNEKTPSFYVNEDKGFYHCFGCGVHGDVIRFVVEQEGLRFPEAVKSLASEAGLEVPEESPEAQARAKAADGLHEVVATAAAWYTAQLSGLSGSNARKYVEARGLTAETIKRFALGYAPDGNKLRSALTNVSEAMLTEAGLIGHAEERSDSYDRFRNRLIFPIRNPRGQVVGFGGRILGEGQPKYLNSPDTPLFDKGRLLYNLDQAGPVARKSGRLVVVEGYMDVIAIAQAGFAEAVAPLGTAVTEQQLQLMWRVVPEPILCFDGDAAGQRAALRAATRALPLLEPGRSLRFATLPAGLDPDDLVKSQGAAAFEAVIAAAEPLIDRLWSSEIIGVDLATPERRARARESLREHSRAIAHADVRALYEAEFRNRFDDAFLARPERPAFKRGAKLIPPPARASAALKARLDPDSVWTNAILCGLLNHPGMIVEFVEDLVALEIPDSRGRRLMAALIDAAIAQPDLDNQRLDHTLAGYNYTALADEVRQTNPISFSFTRPDAPADTARDDLRTVIENLIARRGIAGALAEATVRYQASGTQDDWDEQQRLLRERDRLADMMKQLAHTRREADAAQ